MKNLSPATRRLKLHAAADLASGQRLGCTALTEASADSDFGAIQTLAKRSGDGWRNDGAKAWITKAAEADVIVLYAQTEAGADGRGIACFLVDALRPGVVREPAFALSGQHTIGTGAFRLEGYVAQRDEMLQPPGQAFKTALVSIDQRRAHLHRGDVQRHGRRGLAHRAGLWRHTQQLRQTAGRPPGLVLAAGRGQR